MGKKILAAAIAVILIGVCTAIYMWNKPHPKAEDARGVPVTAVDLTREYGADEKKANAQYLNKVLSVTGAVDEVTRNQDGGVVVNLVSGDPLAAVQCTMKDKDVNVAKGQTITIKGFCKGNNLGVVIDDCIIQK